MTNKKKTVFKELVSLNQQKKGNIWCYHNQNLSKTQVLRLTGGNIASQWSNFEEVTRLFKQKAGMLSLGRFSLRKEGTKFYIVPSRRRAC